MTTKFKKSFSPMLICWNDIKIHLGFEDSYFVPPPTTSLLLYEIYGYLTVSTGVVGKWRRRKANDWKQEECPHSLGVWKHLTFLQRLTLLSTSSYLNNCFPMFLCNIRLQRFYKKIPRKYSEPENASAWLRPKTTFYYKFLKCQKRWILRLSWRFFV